MFFFEVQRLNREVMRNTKFLTRSDVPEKVCTVCPQLFALN